MVVRERSVAYFCKSASRTQRLTALNLKVGEESVPITLASTGPTENLQGVSFFQDKSTVFLVEDVAAGRGRDRVISLTGRAPGAATINAADPTLSGPNRYLASLTVTTIPDPPDTVDMIYSGKYLYWRNSLPASLKGKPFPLLFSATSGQLMHQIVKDQAIRDEGPIPAGVYTFSSDIDPKQASFAMASNRQGSPAHSPDGPAFKNNGEGIQFLPGTEQQPANTDWGTLRVRLTSLSGNTPGRNGFFLHNSRKGYSHGCIEVGTTPDGLTDFFAALLLYAAESGKKARLSVRVAYSWPEQTTGGATKRGWM